jgi:hypothetical protein
VEVDEVYLAPKRKGVSVCLWPESKKRPVVSLMERRHDAGNYEDLNQNVSGKWSVTIEKFAVEPSAAPAVAMDSIRWESC